MNATRELIWSVKRTINKVCCIIISTIVEREKKGTSRLWQERYSLTIFVMLFIVFARSLWSPSTSLTIRQRELISRIRLVSDIAAIIVLLAELIANPFPQADKNQHREERHQYRDDPEILAFLNPDEIWQCLARLVLTVITEALIAVTASVTDTFVALAHDVVRAVALGTARSAIFCTFFIWLACLIAVQKVWANHINAASAHTLEPVVAHVVLLLATMQTYTRVSTAEIRAAVGRRLTVGIHVAKAKVVHYVNCYASCARTCARIGRDRRISHDYICFRCICTLQLRCWGSISSLCDHYWCSRSVLCLTWGRWRVSGYHDSGSREISCDSARFTGVCWPTHSILVCDCARFLRSIFWRACCLRWFNSSLWAWTDLWLLYYSLFSWIGWNFWSTNLMLVGLYQFDLSVIISVRIHEVFKHNIVSGHTHDLIAFTWAVCYNLNFSISSVFTCLIRLDCHYFWWLLSWSLCLNWKRG